MALTSKIIVHECSSEHMDFRAKNFDYTSKKFGNFIDEIQDGKRMYLRSLSSENPSSTATELAKDFPSIAADFQLPPALNFASGNAHSSPLRISGPLIMWLHYDVRRIAFPSCWLHINTSQVMANVLCQIQGTKKLLLFPPSDFQYFDFEPGVSSSHINVFESK
jgi:tRNA wybutosine-synthesizing protein 4